jgi:hypothetical protein
MLLLLPSASHAQELEPRAYSASPVGTNFIVASYSRLDGQVLTDPSLPITDVQAKIDLQTLGYVRTFGLAGHAASLGLLMPFAQADVSGNVFEAAREVHRAGPGDARLRLAVNLVGAAALAPREFAQREPATTLGASLTVIAPTGQYTSSRLVNIGSNRWAFKPEIGISQPLGKWFVEASAGAWLFTDNDDFFGGRRRSQDPLSVLQLHAGYNLQPGMWVAADVGRYAGGRTKTNGVYNQDRQENMRYGVTLSVPLASGWSAKLGWSKGVVTRAGGDFKVIAVALQYRWFDR